MRRFFSVVVSAAVCMAAEQALARNSTDPVERGQYLVRAAGCVGCHTDTKGKGGAFAGGRADGS